MCRHLLINVCGCAILLGLCQTSEAKLSLSSFTIGSDTPKIELGVPLYVTLNIEYEGASMLPKSGKLPKYRRLSGWRYQVRHEQDKASTEYIIPLPLKFELQGDGKRAYSARLELLFHLSEEKGKLTHNVVFNRPGKYTLTVSHAHGSVSNALYILVKDSPLGKQALSLLSGNSKTVAFLLGGVYKSEKTIANAKLIVQKCGNTTLANIASVRLGIEYYREFKRKHPSLDKFRRLYLQGEIEEPLLERSRGYLTRSSALPTLCPLREEGLYVLFKAEYARADYPKCYALLAELHTKYPRGRFGRKAWRYKEELHRIEESEKKGMSKQGTATKERQGNFSSTQTQPKRVW